MDKSLERLSSGYRINRAGDDAAGLAISENLKAQIRGLKQASRNAQDGVSLVQVAEGSLNEISAILIRLRELAVQAASDTIGPVERQFLNVEYDQLISETDRIADGTEFKEITPAGYVEGSVMFHRQGKYYFMWSEGGWTGPDYCVAYAMADSPTGPYKRIGKVLQQDKTVATGAGHHSVIKLPGKEIYYIVYHRRPLGETDGNHRVTCIDRMEFDDHGLIKPVKITFKGVEAAKL